MDRYVLDASALLAMVLGEPGGDLVWERRHGALLSAVNYAEVLSRLVRHGKSPGDAEARLDLLQLDVVPFEKAQAAAVASLARPGKPPGLSPGGRACLALALSRGLPALTADGNWGKLDVGVKIELIR